MPKQSKKTITTTYLRQTTVRKLKIYAARTNRSMSDVMDKAVIQYVDEKPSKPVKAQL